MDQPKKKKKPPAFLLKKLALVGVCVSVLASISSNLVFSQQGTATALTKSSEALVAGQLSVNLNATDQAAVADNDSDLRTLAEEETPGGRDIFTSTTVEKNSDNVSIVADKAFAAPPTADAFNIVTTETVKVTDTDRLLDDNDNPVALLGNPTPFYFYVYDNGQDAMNPQNISHCMKRRYGQESNCDWGLSICTETKSARRYSSWRHNFNADVAIADLFQRYPILAEYGAMNESAPATASFATRTLDPNQADVFVVPYPHDSHCKCLKSSTFCRDDKDKGTSKALERLLESLTFRNETTAARHLFISSTDYPYPHKTIMDQLFRTTLGDLRTRACKSHDPSCGHVVIPYMNTNADYQPAALRSRPASWWTERPRTYSVTGLFGRVGGKGGAMGARNTFIDSNSEFLGTEVGGLPTNTKPLKSRSLKNEMHTLEMYQNSTFCMVLAGDGPPQKRFFDVTMSGCIPVVLSHETREKDFPSYFRAGGASIRRSYPFPKGFYRHERTVGIDYSSFVVEIDGACGFKCLKPRLEEVMSNSTELLRLQQNVRKHAALFSYGLEGNSHKDVDAFAVLLAQMGHYSEQLRIHIGK